MPGMPISTAGNVSDVVVGARTPIINASASEGSKAETKGRRIASPVVPPRPGRIPTANPSKTPSVRNTKCWGSKSCSKTEKKRSMFADPP